MGLDEPDSEELVRRAGAGDKAAIEQLLATYRTRLRKMVAVRMDPRLLARLDPSDVVQEALITAARKLPEYLRERPLPFYPWLRQVAWNRLVDLHRRHLQARKRRATSEERGDMGLPDQSAMQLAGRLLSTGTSPSGRLMREERRERVRAALTQLPPHDREVLVLRYLEQLSIGEIAAVLKVTEGAVNMRQVRALERLATLLGNEVAEGPL